MLICSSTPLGFGVTARSSGEAKRLDPTGIVVFRQADCGEYLREEDTLFQS
jgi:60S ribosome subunit biogenesis protein NIP7